MILSQPTILESNFLTEEEIEDVRSKILSSKDQWKKGHWDNVYMLPKGMYLSDYEEYKTSVAVSNPFMIDQFSFYYDKILNRLSSYYDIPITYRPDILQMPGFHIFTEGMVLEDYNYHHDNFPYIKNIIDEYDRIDSFIIPITNPANGAGLSWTLDGIEYQTIKYSEGMLAAWPGNVKHSIDLFRCNEGDMRITMQIHLHILNNSGIIFW